MGGFVNIARGVAGGLADAAGNDSVAQDARKQIEQDKQLKMDQMKQKIAPLTMASESDS